MEAHWILTPECDPLNCSPERYRASRHPVRQRTCWSGDVNFLAVAHTYQGIPSSLSPPDGQPLQPHTLLTTTTLTIPQRVQPISCDHAHRDPNLLLTTRFQRVARTVCTAFTSVADR